MNKPQVISATELRSKTRDVIEQAHFSGLRFIVETFGRPMVAIIGVKDYERLVAMEMSLSHASEGDHGQMNDPSDRASLATE